MTRDGYRGPADEVTGPSPSRGPASRGPGLAGTIFLAVCLVSGCYAALIRGVVVRSRSMEPTLRTGDLVVTEGLSLAFGRAPSHGTLVSLEDPRSPGRTLLKRVVAVGGDAVALRGRRLLRNRQEIPERYARYRKGGAQDLLPVIVPSGCVVVLGDDRDQSRDSRELGPVAASLLHGRVLFRLWPLTRFGRID